VETGADVVCGSCTKGSEPGTAAMRMVIPDGEGGATIQEVGEVRCPGAVIEFMDAAIKNVKHSQKIQGTTLILESTNVLTQSTVYTIRIRDQKLRVLKEFSFLTLTVQPSPDTRPEAALTKTIERTLRERPDVYLANLLPYQSFDFSMVLEIDDQGYFQFKVSSSRLSGAILKDRVAQWLLGLELSQKQISGLNIIYP